VSVRPDAVLAGRDTSSTYYPLVFARVFLKKEIGLSASRSSSIPTALHPPRSPLLPPRCSNPASHCPPHRPATPPTLALPCPRPPRTAGSLNSGWELRTGSCPSSEIRLSPPWTWCGRHLLCSLPRSPRRPSSTPRLRLLPPVNSTRWRGSILLSNKEMLH
jgi:hypothetical protein